MELLVLGLALITIVWMATIVVRLQLKTLSLERLAIRDELTGLYNHREIERLLHEAIGRAERRRIPVAAIILDLDFFKRVNDVHGHSRGDRVLRELGIALRENLELGDLVGRWGGEEFLVILPGVSVTEAAAIAERLRKIVAEQTLAGLKLTISLGVASSTGSPEALFNEADAALLRAKNDGRNRVASY